MLLLFITSLLSGSHGALQFASYYQDHMVLQRGPQQAVVWGHATKIGDSVTVQVSGHGSVTGKVTKDAAGHGMWKVKLPAITDKGPFTVTVTSSEGTVTIKDVLFGDVWLCSGQSNMEFPLGSVINDSQEVKHSLDFPDIRILHTSHVTSNHSLSDLIMTNVQSSKWTKPSQGMVRHFSAVCWLFGEYLYPSLNHPIGLVQASWGGTGVDVWASPDALAACPRKGKRRPDAPSVLWNSMINPLLDMTIFGVIWYQGEANTNQPDHYACQFPAMISDWRKKFHDASMGTTNADFPFGFVQLAGNRPDKTIVGGFPTVRWAQTANQGDVPNTRLKNAFMAVAMDLPDFTAKMSVHSRYKQEVARRLVLSARGVAYKQADVKFQGPFPAHITENSIYNEKTLKIVYDHGPVTVNNQSAYEVCCSTGLICDSHDSWVEAPMQSYQASTVVLSTIGCGSRVAVGVRYAWRESPCDYEKCAIYGKDTSLPAPPFIHTGGFGPTGIDIVG